MTEGWDIPDQIPSVAPTNISPKYSYFYLRQNLNNNAEQVIEYLGNKAFCLNGQIAVASIFVFAKEHGIPVDAVIVETDKEWTRNWHYQHPEIRGSADAPGAAGIENRISLENIYSTLSVQSPA
ncbi:MAG: hypothetical protein JW740_00170 [Candidatus Zambryskibacteria bacterium]|nr:hypothetical protein [Candidatus Zambryskibacteria bacterium]